MKRQRFLVWLASTLLLMMTLIANHLSISLADPPSEVAVIQNPAVRYCLDNGGVAQLRFPAFDTNNANFTRLAGERPFCQFSARDNSKIFVDIDTLFAEKPTMAALAYLTAAAPSDADRVTSGANPSTLYCAKLGGSSSFGGRYTNAGGGGYWWISRHRPVSCKCVCFRIYPVLMLGV